MSGWEKIKDTDYGLGYVVHEVRCKECKYCITYINGLLPKICYCCGKDMEHEGLLQHGKEDND